LPAAFSGPPALTVLSEDHAMSQYRKFAKAKIKGGQLFAMIGDEGDEEEYALKLPAGAAKAFKSLALPDEDHPIDEVEAQARKQFAAQPGLQASFGSLHRQPDDPEYKAGLKRYIAAARYRASQASK
jgi:hypothetical protein